MRPFSGKSSSRIHFRKSLSESIGQRAAALIERHALSDGLQLADALIAATAIEYGEKLATGNARHFRSIRNLELHAFKPRGA